MKTTITVEGDDVRIAFQPENELERVALAELGDDVSVSRSHQSVVLRKRRSSGTVRRISDVSNLEP